MGSNDVLDNLIAPTSHHYQTVLASLQDPDTPFADLLLQRFHLRQNFFDRAREDPSCVNILRPDWPTLFNSEQIDTIAMEIWEVCEPEGNELIV